MTPKFYELLERCIEDGLERGWRLSHKHTDTPTPDVILTQQYQSIFTELHEWFDFDAAMRETMQ